MSKISIVIPCYSSSATLPFVAQRIRETMEGTDYELILVNDYSPDNTFQVIQTLAKDDSRIIGINLARNFGQHSAIFAGLHHASGEEIVCLDDDGQTPPEGIPKLLEAIRGDYDVAYARYQGKCHSRFRNLGSAINSLMAEKLIGKPRDLFLSSFFAMRRYILKEILKYDGPFVYLQGLVLRTTGNICNVDIEHQERLAGKSGYSLKTLLKLWLNGFTAFSIKPLHLADLVGLIIAIIGFIYMLYTVIRYFIKPGPAIGWNSLMAVLLMLGGSIMLMLGMVGEYIGRVYISLNRSPQFVVREIVRQEEEAKNYIKCHGDMGAHGENS